MTLRFHPVDPNSPGIRRSAKRYERRLRRVLAIAARMDSKRNAVLARLYREARVEGISERLPTKTSIIAFEAPPFGGGLYWDELASNILRRILERHSDRKGQILRPDADRDLGFCH